jgi:hypothetical protein
MTPQIRDAEKLCPCIRKRHKDFVALALARGIYPVTIETLRAEDRQAYYVEIGVSWSMGSKHLPQPPNQLALAFDVCPQEYLAEPRWNPKGPLWDEMGRIGRSLGLLWGGDWKRTPDKPHFYLERCLC